MEVDTLITVVILASVLFSGAAAIRARNRRWMVVIALNLAALGISWGLLRGWVAWIAGPVWVVTMLAPSLAIRIADIFSRRERFTAATWFARIAALLHPAPLTKQRVLIAEAQRLEQAGETDASRRVLDRLAEQPGGQLMAKLLSLRIEQHWSEIRALIEADPSRAAFNPMAFSFWLRALGETGAREELIAAYAASAKAKQNAPVEAQVLLFTAAFGGRERATANILAAQHSDMPADARELWMLTAAGMRRDVSKELQALAATARPRVAAVARTRTTPTTPLSVESEMVLDGLEREAERLELVRAPTLRATTVLALLNVYVFLREIPGGTMNPGNLLRLGALDTAFALEPWRYAAAATLHFGFWHVAMNTLGLLVLGPTVEAAIGRVRMVILYVVAAIGANVLGIVWMHSDSARETTLVGASGAVMGVAGGLLVHRVLGWRKRRTQAARSEMMRLFAVMVVQVISDQVVPNVAGSVHIFGFVVGAVLMLPLSIRRGTPVDWMKRGGWVFLSLFAILFVGGLQWAWALPQPYMSTRACSEDQDVAACRQDCEAVFGPIANDPLPAPREVPNRKYLLRSCDQHAYYANRDNRADESFRVYEATCNAGDALACNNEGIFFEGGHFGRVDIARARALYDKACSGGFAKGCEELERLKREYPQ